MTFPHAPAGGRAAECKPSPPEAAAAHPAELPPQPPQPPKYRQFFKLAICLKAQVCKRRKIAQKGTTTAAIDPPRAAPRSGAEIIAGAPRANGDRGRVSRGARRQRAKTRQRTKRATYLLLLSLYQYQLLQYTSMQSRQQRQQIPADNSSSRGA